MTDFSATLQAEVVATIAHHITGSETLVWAAFDVSGIVAELQAIMAADELTATDELDDSAVWSAIGTHKLGGK